MADRDDVLQAQIAYYRARANEYDEWFLREGRYDHGPEANQRWFDELEHVAGALAAFAPRGEVLELACGTGQWTPRLAAYADRLTCVDASPEVLEINRARMAELSAQAKVRYVEADLFGWRPDRKYDAVFFGFWLSHVPAERFAAFWALVRDCLAPGGRVFFVDSRLNPESSAKGQHLQDAATQTSRRRLNDGREFEIVKVFYEPTELGARLADLGWRVEVCTTVDHFIYGYGGVAPHTN